jgi:hypothetical protein
MKLKSIFFVLIFFGIGCFDGGESRSKEKLQNLQGTPKNLEQGELQVLEQKEDLKPKLMSPKILEVNILTLDSIQDRPRIPNPCAIVEDSSDLENELCESVTRTKSETRFHTKFYLPNLERVRIQTRAQARHQFIVWPEEFDGFSIQSAFYSHRVLRDGKWLGNFRPKKVWHDDIHSRWFIPIFDIFQDSDFYSEDDARLDDLQVVTLDLVLDSGMRFSYQVKFQVVGPLPELEIQSSESPLLSDSRDLGNHLASVGWIIKREALVNPSPQSLYLWLRSPQVGEDVLTLTTYLDFSYFVEQPHSAPLGPEIQSWASRANLKVDELRIVRQSNSDSGGTEILTLEPGEWQGVAVGPGETLILEWVARTESGVRDCKLPDPQNLSLFWTSLPSLATPVPSPAISGIGSWSGKQNFLNVMRLASQGAEKSQEAPTLPVTFHQNGVNEWSIRGAGISGRWSRELRISYPFLSKNDATDDSFGKTIARGFIETHSTVGQTVSNPPLYSCQGVFR